MRSGAVKRGRSSGGESCEGGQKPHSFRNTQKAEVSGEMITKCVQRQSENCTARSTGGHWSDIKV